MKSAYIDKIIKEKGIESRKVRLREAYIEGMQKAVQIKQVSSRNLTEAMQKNIANSQSKMEATGIKQLPKTQKETYSTDSDIIKAYEAIPNHNVLLRGGTSANHGGRANTVEKAEYNKKQEMYPAYRQAKNRQISDFMSQNGITYDNLKSIFDKEYNYSAYTNRKHSGNQKAPADIDSLYASIKAASDKAGIDLQDIKDFYNATSVNDFSKKARDYADKNGVKGTIASLGTNLVGNISKAATEGVNYLTGTPIGSNEEVNALAGVTGNMRSAVKENIDNSVKNPLLRKAANTMYDVGVSIGDQLTSLGAVKGSKALSLGLMATGAGSNTLQEVQGKDITPDQMMATAVSSAAIEALTEKLPLDNLFRVASSTTRQSAAEIVKNVLKQAGTEATEEGISEIANTFVDNLINDGESNWQQSIRAYMASGMTREQAQQQAKIDLSARVGQAALTGGLAGGIMAGGASVYANSKLPGITPEQYQANADYIQKLENVNAGQNYLDSYNGHTAELSTPVQSRNAINGINEMNLAKATEAAEQSTATEVRSQDGEVGQIPTASRGSQNSSVNNVAGFENNVNADTTKQQENSANGYSGRQVDSIPEMSKDLSRFISMHGSDSTKSLYMQFNELMNKGLNEADVTAFSQAILLAEQIETSLQTEGHDYVTKGSKNGKKPGRTYHYEAGQFYDTLINYWDLMNEKYLSTRGATQTANETASADNVSEVNVGRAYTSQTAQNSLLNSPMMQRAQQNVDSFQKEIDNQSFEVNKVSEKESMKAAAQNLAADYDGTVQKIKDSETLYNGIATDEAMMVLDNMLSEAESSGDYAKVTDWAKMIVKKAHGVGQALQAFAKYTRTPEGTIVKAQQILNDQADSYYKENPGAKSEIETTTNELWSQLEMYQKSADTIKILHPGINQLTPDLVRKIVRDVLEKNRILKKMDSKSLDNAADYIARQIERGADHTQIAEDIQNYAATGLFGLDDTDIETVMDMLGKAEEMSDSKARYELEQQAIDIIANKVCNTSFMDKLNAWRYLSMLGNTKTHLRNFLGNVLNGMVTGVKNNVAATLEAAYEKAGGKIDRTKAVLNPISDADLIKAGKTDADTNVYSMLKDGGSNYNTMLNRIEGSKTVYKNKFFEKLRTFNSDALELEDMIGLRNKYATSLAGYLKANGYGTEIFRATNQTDVDFLNKARAYAIDEAKVATFHEYNKFASWLNRTSNELKNGGVGGKVGNVLIEGTLPFKKTPANILKQGWGYATGPFELLFGVRDLCRSVKSQKCTASQAINRIAKGMTGTSILGLGFFLSSIGLITGGASEDEKDAGFDKLTGGQNYALKIGDKSYTIDWLAPFALPLFVGVEAQKFFNGKSDKGSVIDILDAAAAPMLELSMLDGLSSTLENVQYSDGAWDAIKSFTASTGANYASQFVPTVSGQIARSVDPVRRSTAPDNNGVIGDFEYAGRKIANKIPYVSGLVNQPYINQWGDTQENAGGSILGRLAYNMFSPGYYSEQSYDSVESELSNLRGLTGDSKVYPSKAGRKVGDVRLTGSEYTEYAKSKGHIQHEALSTLFKSDLYDVMTDGEKVDAIKGLYNAAGQIAQDNIGYSPANMTYVDVYNNSGIEALVNCIAIKNMSGVSSYKQKKNAFDTLGAEKFQDWNELMNGADADGSGTITQAEGINAIMESGVDYDTAMQYALPLFNDTKNSTAEEKAKKALEGYGDHKDANASLKARIDDIIAKADAQKRQPSPELKARIDQIIARADAQKQRQISPELKARIDDIIAKADASK